MKEKRKMQQKKIKKKKIIKQRQAILKGSELNDFVVHLSFFQLICNASSTFKSNLELALSIILTTKRI